MSINPLYVPPAPPAVASAPVEPTSTTVSPETAALVVGYHDISLAQTSVITVTESAGALGQQLHTLETQMSALNASGAAVPAYLVTQAYTLEQQAQDLRAFQYELALANPSSPTTRDYGLYSMFDIGKIGDKI